MSTASACSPVQRSSLVDRLAGALLALALGLLAGCAPQIDPDRRVKGVIEQQGWWIDRTGSADLSQVQQVTDWTEFSGLTKFGFGAEPVWFKLRVAAARSDTERLSVLRVLPAYLDRVTFHDPVIGREAATGRTVPSQGEMISSINFSFPVPPHSQARDLYLKIESLSTRLALVDLLTYSEATYRNRLQEWLFAVLIALSAMSVLWAIAEWLINREAVVALFAIKQSIATLWALVAAGFARILISPDLPVGLLTNLQSTLMPFTIAASTAFVTVLLSKYQPSRVWIRLLLILIVGFLLLPLLQLAGLARELRVIANTGIPIIFVILLLTLASVAHRRTDEPLPKSLTFTYLCAYSVMLTVPVGINLGGLGPGFGDGLPEFGDNAIPVGSAISVGEILAVYGSLASLMLDGLMMRILLMRRTHLQRKAQRATELELQRSEEESKARRLLNEEQGKLFSMLAHEIKTPLATIRMWANAGPAGQAAIASAISDMNLVIERCVHTGQLAEQGLQPSPQAGDALAETQLCIRKSRDPGRMHLVAPDGPAGLTTDLQMLSIILVNVLDNACKYSLPGSPISIRLDEQPLDGRPGWSWTVSNTPGPAGLPDVARLFEKYYRSPGARHQSGSGLGLFLVRGLLDLMQGTVRFETREGLAVFSIWLPASAEER